MKHNKVAAVDLYCVCVYGMEGGVVQGLCAYAKCSDFINLMY